MSLVVVEEEEGTLVRITSRIVFVVFSDTDMGDILAEGPNDLVLGVPQPKLIVLGDAKRPLAWAEAAVLVLDADGLASFDASRERKVGSTGLDVLVDACEVEPW